MNEHASSRLITTVNTFTTVGRHLLRASTICVIGSLIAFGVAVVADYAHEALEWLDYADDGDPYDYSFRND